MFQHRIVKGLILPLFVVVTLIPTRLTAQDVCVAAWATDAVAAYQQAERQAQGQLFVDCGEACDESALDALASYERAVLQASGQVMIDVAASEGNASEALAVYQRAEMQAQGQSFVEPVTLACAGGESALS